MKKILLGIIIITLFGNCKKDDAIQSSCVSVLLPNYGFDTGNAINTNLALYSGIDFAGNTLEINGYSVRGFVLYNTGFSIVAYELSDPAHGPNSCSKMSLSGIELSCQCDDGNKYEMVTGQQISGTTGHCLKAYRVERNGNIIRVFN